jgi:hypothetical protein
VRLQSSGTRGVTICCVPIQDAIRERNQTVVMTFADRDSQSFLRPLWRSDHQKPSQERYRCCSAIALLEMQTVRVSRSVNYEISKFHLIVHIFYLPNYPKVSIPQPLNLHESVKHARHALVCPSEEPRHAWPSSGHAQGTRRQGYHPPSNPLLSS